MLEANCKYSWKPVKVRVSPEQMQILKFIKKEIGVSHECVIQQALKAYFNLPQVKEKLETVKNKKG